MSNEIKSGSKVSIVAASFSIYVYQELKKELEQCDEFRFIFTAPTFITEKAKKEKREFYILRMSREQNLYGIEFEIKLRNEMTQKAKAKKCAEWIKRKGIFKSNVTQKNMPGFIHTSGKSYAPISSFQRLTLPVREETMHIP